METSVSCQAHEPLSGSTSTKVRFSTALRKSRTDNWARTVSTSCGFTVPYFSYEGERLELDECTYKELLDDSETDEKTGLSETLLWAWNLNNALSIDTLPGLKLASNLSLARKPAFATYGTLQNGRIQDADSTFQTLAAFAARGWTRHHLVAIVAAFVCGLAVSSLHSTRSPPYLPQVL